MRASDLPWLLGAVVLVALGGALVWWALTQLAAGGSDIVAVGLYLLALIGGVNGLALGLLGLALYLKG